MNRIETTADAKHRGTVIEPASRWRLFDARELAGYRDIKVLD
jgi:hypothetical protein